MNAKTQDRLESLIGHYRNGNRAFAARLVRALSKTQLCELLINDHRLQNGYLGDGEGRYDFQQFVSRALDGWGE
jgi:hypothetical protein